MSLIAISIANAVSSFIVSPVNVVPAETINEPGLFSDASVYPSWERFQLKADAREKSSASVTFHAIPPARVRVAFLEDSSLSLHVIRMVSPVRGG